MIKKNPAFTLIELLVAITIFVLFISFGMLSFSIFHRTQLDAAKSREMMFELSHTMDILTEAIKENKIDYAYYIGETSCADSVQSTIFNTLSSSAINASITFNLNPALDESELVLLSLDGLNRTVFSWDSSVETISIQKFTQDENCEFKEDAGYPNPLVLHSSGISVSTADFRIFPNVDPYDSVNFASLSPSGFYQPNVKIKLTFSTPGQAKPAIIIDLQTTVTSRVYQ